MYPSSSALSSSSCSSPIIRNLASAYSCFLWNNNKNNYKCINPIHNHTCSNDLTWTLGLSAFSFAVLFFCGRLSILTVGCWGIVICWWWLYSCKPGGNITTLLLLKMIVCKNDLNIQIEHITWIWITKIVTFHFSLQKLVASS